MASVCSFANVTDRAINSTSLVQCLFGEDDITLQLLFNTGFWNGDYLWKDVLENKFSEIIGLSRTDLQVEQLEVKLISVCSTAEDTTTTFLWLMEFKQSYNPQAFGPWFKLVSISFQLVLTLKMRERTYHSCRYDDRNWIKKRFGYENAFCNVAWPLPYRVQEHWGIAFWRRLSNAWELVSDIWG